MQRCKVVDQSLTTISKNAAGGGSSVKVKEETKETETVVISDDEDENEQTACRSDEGSHVKREEGILVEVTDRGKNSRSIIYRSEDGAACLKKINVCL